MVGGWKQRLMALTSKAKGTLLGTAGLAEKRSRASILLAVTLEAGRQGTATQHEASNEGSRKG